MNSLFEQGENVAFSANGDDKQNSNAKGQSSNKVQMPKFKGRTAGLGTRDQRLERELTMLGLFIVQIIPNPRSYPKMSG